MCVPSRKKCNQWNSTSEIMATEYGLLSALIKHSVQPWLQHSEHQIRLNVNTSRFCATELTSKEIHSHFSYCVSVSRTSKGTLNATSTMKQMSADVRNSVWASNSTLLPESTFDSASRNSGEATRIKHERNETSGGSLATGSSIRLEMRLPRMKSKTKAVKVAATTAKSQKTDNDIGLRDSNVRIHFADTRSSRVSSFTSAKGEKERGTKDKVSTRLPIHSSSSKIPFQTIPQRSEHFFNASEHSLVTTSEEGRTVKFSILNFGESSFTDEKLGLW